ncbi:MAG: hypothetical protein ACOYNO_15545 [Saprospiraceae bacterium]
MKMLIPVSFFLATWFIFQEGNRYQSSAIKVALGENHCYVSLKTTEKAVATLVALHPNERTCTKVFDALPQYVHLNLLSIEQEQKRLLSYRSAKTTLLFDPNRIFTDTGIKETLQFHNLGNPLVYKQEIKRFADTLLACIYANQKSRQIIAIHNNSNDNFSILSYQNSPETKDLFIHAGEDVDNFVIVTDEQDFAFYKRHNLNTVLLADTLYTDDGSLSVYCLQNGIPYINIEVQDGDEQKQIELLCLTYDLLVRRTASQPAPKLPHASPE